jgi:cytochrome c oxidase subunit IV
MSSWTATDRQMGTWSALGVFVLGVLYLFTGAAWFVAGGDLATPLGDPYLAVLEILILLSAPPMVAMMAAVHAYAPPESKTYSRVALGFMFLVAGLTSSVHFVQLTVGRRLDAAGVAGISGILSLRWPSVMYALDILAWDLFLGLSLLFAAPTFKGAGLPATIRVSLIISGALCIAGLLGPALGNMAWQRLGILGYSVVFPVVCLLLALLFRRSPVA